MESFVGAGLEVPEGRRHRTRHGPWAELQLPIVGHILSAVLVRRYKCLSYELTCEDMYALISFIAIPGVKVLKICRLGQLEDLILCRVFVIVAPLTSRLVQHTFHPVRTLAGLRHTELDERVALPIERGGNDRLSKACDKIRLPEDAASEPPRVIEQQWIGLGENSLTISRDVEGCEVDDRTLKRLPVAKREGILLSELLALGVERRNDRWTPPESSVEAGALVEDNRHASRDQLPGAILQRDVGLLHLHRIVSSVELLHRAGPVDT